MDLTQASACMVLAMLAASDLRSRRLPNPGVAAFSALFFIDAGLAGTSLATLGAHVAAGAVAFAAAALMFALRWLGGGDAKLAAAIFLWAGPAHALPVLVVVSVCGAFVGLAMMAVGWTARCPALISVTSRLEWLSPARGVPYGIALAAGGIVAILLHPAHISHAILQPYGLPHFQSLQIGVAPAPAPYASRLAG